MTDAIEVRNLSKSYPDFKLDDVSFNLPKGYIMGFIGPNGSGKTTTIKLLLNMIWRESGEVKLFGLDNLTHESEIKKHVGIVFDSHYFIEDWTLTEIDMVMKGFFENWDSTAYLQWLERYQLNRNAMVKDLSKGMQMKLMLACAFSHDARLLILDEPTSGLDPVAREDLLADLSEFIQDGERSVLFSTHITQDLERIADYITFIHQGKLLYTGTKDTFIDSFRLVKGGVDALTPELRRDLVGVREYASGFEGVLHTDAVDRYPGLLTEKASIDEIIVFTYKGNNGR